MDWFKPHANNRKRKLHASQEQEKNFKKKDLKNDTFTSCFRTCCTKKKNSTEPLKDKNICMPRIEQVPLENENINLQLKSNIPLESIPIEEISNDQLNNLKPSLLHKESEFCQNIFDSYDDSCIDCTIQYGPDSNENIHDYLRKLEYQTNKEHDTSMSIEQNGLVMDEKINDDDDKKSSIEKEKLVNRTLSGFELHVNSFINNIIGDGVDRVCEIIKTTPIDVSHQTNFKVDNQFNNKIENLNLIKQNQYPGLLFEKQNFIKTTPNCFESSIGHSLDNYLFESDAANYRWDSISNEQNFDQQNLSDKINSLQNQEPYNWECKENSWSLEINSSKHDHLANKSIYDHSEQMSPYGEEKVIVSNDDDLSYSIASVLPLNTILKIESNENTLKNQSQNILYLEKSVITSEVHDHSTKIINHESKSEHSHRTIFSTNSKDQNITNDMNSFSIINSNQSLKTNKHISTSSLLNHISYSKNILNPNDLESSSSSYVLMQQNDRFSTTSVSDLFMQIDYAKKQKSIDSKSNNTGYSIPISLHPSVSSETIDTDDSNQNKLRTSRTTMLSNVEKKFNKNLIIINEIDHSEKTYIDESTKSSHSNSTNEHDKQILINNNINQTTRSTYEDIMCSWRRFLQRLAGFILPPMHNNTAYSMMLSSSIMRPDSHSWPTLMPTRTLNMTQSNNICPCWHRNDIHKQTPGTFLFSNERLNTSHSMETNTNKKQMCISIENRPYYSKYYSCPNRYHCCCSSSITINNCSSSF